jgi:hypothetical protein
VARGRGRPPGKVSDESATKARESARKPRILLPMKDREGLLEAKKQLAKALAEHGVGYIVDVIRRGPWQDVEVTREGEQSVIPLYEARSQLWQYAMNFAADRGGLYRITEMDLALSSEIPPIQVNIVGHARPSDT